MITILLVLGGACTELTFVSAERVPPPSRTTQNEGPLLPKEVDLCPLLSVGSPIRISATAPHSVDVQLAALPVEGGQSLIAIAWREKLEPGSTVNVRLLLEDGTAVGPVRTVPIDADSMSLFSVPSSDRFGLLVEGDYLQDDELEHGLTLYYLSTRGLVDADLGTRAPDLEHPFALAVADTVLVGALTREAPTSTTSEIVLFEVNVADSVRTELQPTGLPATRFSLVQSPDQPFLAWLHGDVLHAAKVIHDDEEERLVVDGDQPFDLSSIDFDAQMLEMHGAAAGDRLLVPLLGKSMERDQWLFRVMALSGEGWSSALDESDVVPGWGPDDASVDIAVEEGGRRWSVARIWSAKEDSPGELRLERLADTDAGGGQAQWMRTSLDVTTDLVRSSQPAIVALREGYGVAYCDEVAGGEDWEGQARVQRDIFYSILTCRPSPLGE